MCAEHVNVLEGCGEHARYGAAPGISAASGCGEQAPCLTLVGRVVCAQVSAHCGTRSCDACSVKRLLVQPLM
jgi:hypothetical protein